MAMIKLFPLLFVFIYSTAAFGQEVSKEMQCRNGGALVIGSWHRLDLCLSHKKLNEKEVSDAKRKISKTYPKIGREVAVGSELSLHMKNIANALPYDFSETNNAELLAGICKSSIGAMRRYVEPDWQKELLCWQ